MASSAALRATGTTRAGAGRGEGSSLPERHLWVLPPVPAAYAVAPARRGPAPQPGARIVPPAPLSAPPLRLTARGRRLVAVLVLAVTVGLVALGESVLGDGGGGLELMGTSSVVVEHGDTLWSIAGSVAGERDVREVVDRIQELNGLRSADIEPGQVLELP